MDIIPGIPDLRGQTATALLVPDKELRCWKATDPKGYAAWFLDRARIVAAANEAIRAEVEPAPSSPNGRRKLTLQIIVQLLKRHRDLMFAEDEDAPISIIITTLAARAYDGSRSVVGALSGVLERMPLYITRTNTGAAFVQNPVNALENFADKWALHPRRERCFFEWIARARLDLNRFEAAQLSNVQDPLGRWVGRRAATGAVRDYGETIQRWRHTGIAVSATTGEIASRSARAVGSPRHTVFRSIDAIPACQNSNASPTSRQTSGRTTSVETTVRPGWQSVSLGWAPSTYGAERTSIECALTSGDPEG